MSFLDNPSRPAAPIHRLHHNGDTIGLTKREHFALEIAKALITRSSMFPEDIDVAVFHADRLLLVLDNTPLNKVPRTR